ncbi:MAG: acetolactate synthase large subunit [Alphaproteobacteria bacterium]|nr:MAG: acetolactate synthase large subunit [Alphaproteobacteria bacterium]
MRGADLIVRTLADAGVELCFTNPGTSEMHLVAALDHEARMRSVLVLFEGVASGAADGYARLADKPAATLFHLGPGLANGIANLHNARRARSPIVNIVGDHARHHRIFDAPLTSDIESLARPVSRWYAAIEDPASTAEITTTAVAQSFLDGGGVASLVVPADIAWQEVQDQTARPGNRPGRASVPEERIAEAAEKLKAAGSPVVFIGAQACREEGLRAAGRLAQALDARLVMETFPARISRGAGRVSATRLQYFADGAAQDLKDADLLLLAGARAPVSFFAYPGQPSSLVPEGAEPFLLGDAGEDVVAALDALADHFGAPREPALDPAMAPPPLMQPDEKLSAPAVGMALARHMPAGSVICDDSTTSGLGVYFLLENAAPHEWLCLTGGAIGAGMPMGVGAALAAPERKVITLNGDGAGAYTLQALWTQARENLNVVNIVFANHSYLILNVELARLGLAGETGGKARAMLSLAEPRMDWVKLAEGFGVAASHARTAGEFDRALASAISASGPQLIVAEIA